MSNPSGFFRGCRALYSAAKSAAASAPKPTAPKKTTPATTNSAATAAVPAAKAKPEKVKKPRAVNPNGGLFKPTRVSSTLEGFVGAPEASRSDAVKKVWEYIKVNNLQNPVNKKEIHCDEKLKTLFAGKDKVGFLEIGKLLSPHFVKTN